MDYTPNSHKFKEEQKVAAVEEKKKVEVRRMRTTFSISEVISELKIG